MGTFSISINLPPLTYDAKANNSILKECLADVPQVLPVKLFPQLTDPGLLSSYTGDIWKTLTITSVTTTNSQFRLIYNNVVVDNSQLPLNIPVGLLTGNDPIPNLEYERTLGFIFINDTEAININFVLSDINDTVGLNVKASYQVSKKVCEVIDIPPTGEAPVLIGWFTGEMYPGNLTYKIGGIDEQQGPFEYQIQAINGVTSFSVIGLPSFLNFNDKTGWITSNADAVAQSYNTATFNITLGVTNAIGSDAQNFKLLVTGGDFPTFEDGDPRGPIEI